jgi:serine phosphatase RsbU (regulator of sigma subunit)
VPPLQIALRSPIALPRSQDVEGADRLPRALWDGAVEHATAELARRARPALVIYGLLLGAAGLASHQVTGGGSGIELPTIVAGLAVLAATLWRHRMIAHPAATAIWWARFGILTLGNGLMLGTLGAVVTLETGISPAAMMYWLILVGATAGATASLIPSVRLARTFAALALVPVAGAATLVSEPGGGTLAFIVMVYLAFISLQIGGAAKTFWSAVMAEMQMQVQSDSVNAARLQAQSAMQAQELVLEELAAHREAAEQDYAVAARVFQNILARCCLRMPSIKASLAPLERFNGDVVMATITPGPKLRLLLGDFTGHGLAAAVGAIPVSEVFFAMAKRNLPIDVVLREVNSKLKKNLPPGLFFAAMLAEIDPLANRLLFWNGGVPPAYLLAADGSTKCELPSGHPPLGIMPDEIFDPALESRDLQLGDRLFMYSDGVVETANAAGELYGTTRLQQALASQPAARFSCPQVEISVAEHRGAEQSRDDVTVLEVRVDDKLLEELRSPTSWEG